MTRTEVREMLERLFPMYERTATDEAINSYFHVLQDSPGSAINSAASRWLSSDALKAPTAAQLKSMIGNSRTNPDSIYRCPEPRRSQAMAEIERKKRERESRVQAIADHLGINMNSPQELSIDETLDQMNALRSAGSPVAEFLAGVDLIAKMRSAR